jgi:hypothetical protein
MRGRRAGELGVNASAYACTETVMHGGGRQVLLEVGCMYSVDWLGSAVLGAAGEGGALG